MKDVAIGIDLGGTRIKGVLLQKSGQIVQQKIAETGDTNDATDLGWKKAIRQMVKDLKPTVYSKISIGISAPGLTDEQNQCIAYMPGRLAGLEYFNWGTYLEEEDARVINDAKAALLAEYYFGAGRGVQNMVLVALGTGVGGAILIDGKLHKGWIDRAGHVGHISLNPFSKGGIIDLPGTLEIAIGNAFIKERSVGRYETTEALVAGYRAGDPWATLVWLESVRNLTLGLSSIINVLSPELIILSGGITQAGNALFDPLQRYMEIFEWRPGGRATSIVSAKYKAFAGAVGAACFALF